MIRPDSEPHPPVPARPRRVVQVFRWCCAAGVAALKRALIDAGDYGDGQSLDAASRA